MFEPDPDGHPRGSDILPQPVDGSVAASLVVAAARDAGHGGSNLSGDVPYSAYATDDRRFAWLHAVPVTDDGGVQFYTLALSANASSDGGWSINDVEVYDSPEDAKIAAGRMWVKETQGRDLPTEPVADW